MLSVGHSSSEVESWVSMIRNSIIRGNDKIGHQRFRSWVQLYNIKSKKGRARWFAVVSMTLDYISHVLSPIKSYSRCRALGITHFYDSVLDHMSAFQHVIFHFTWNKDFSSTVWKLRPWHHHSTQHSDPRNTVRVIMDVSSLSLCQFNPSLSRIEWNQ